jgi:hypothetical protein
VVEGHSRLTACDVSTTPPPPGRYWVTPSPDLFQPVQDLCPRDDRVPERKVFDGVTGDRLPDEAGSGSHRRGRSGLHARTTSATAGSRSCIGRASTGIGQAVGHDDLMTTARTYTHVIADEAEVDYAGVLGG